MKIKKSKQMNKMIDLWVYCQPKPKSVSTARWNAIIRFIEKNFDDLKIAP